MSYNYADRLIIHERNHGAYVRIQDERGSFRAVHLPASEREDAAAALAGDDYRVVPAREPSLASVMDALGVDEAEEITPAIERLKSERDDLQALLTSAARRGASDEADEAAQIRDDLHSILHALNLSTAARASSPHEVVNREIVPAIWRLRHAVSMPEWERELLAGQAAQAEIDQLKRDYDALEKRLCPKCRDLPAQPARPEPVDPASVRVGDVVEIEHAEWALRGEVAEVDDSEPHMRLAIPLPGVRRPIWPDLTGATVRILHAAEPEPDEAAVEALADIVHDVNDSFESTPLTKSATNRFVRELIRRGVEVSE